MRSRAAAVLVVLPIMIIIALSGVSTPRAAASCAYDPNDPKLLEVATVIFTGEIVRNQTAKLGKEREYTFRVTKVYKGAAYAEQIVATDNRSSVGLQINPPGTFLVMAQFIEGDGPGPATRLTTNVCLGTRLVSETDAVPTTLGPGTDPAQGSSRSVTSRFTGKLWIAAGVACIIFAIYIGRRGRRTNPRSS